MHGITLEGGLCTELTEFSIINSLVFCHTRASFIEAKEPFTTIFGNSSKELLQGNGNIYNIEVFLCYIPSFIRVFIGSDLPNELKNLNLN